MHCRSYHIAQIERCGARVVQTIALSQAPVRRLVMLYRFSSGKPHFGLLGFVSDDVGLWNCSTSGPSSRLLGVGSAFAFLFLLRGGVCNVLLGKRRRRSGCIPGLAQVILIHIPIPNPQHKNTTSPSRPNAGTSFHHKTDPYNTPAVVGLLDTRSWGEKGGEKKSNGSKWGCLLIERSEVGVGTGGEWSWGGNGVRKEECVGDVRG